MAKPDLGPWRVSSADGRCQIAVSLNERGEPNYEVKRGGRVVVPASPLGLRCDDESFEKDLSLCAERTATEEPAHIFLVPLTFAGFALRGPQDLFVPRNESRGDFIAWFSL